MDVAHLRLSTRAEHEAVEDCLPLMTPDLTRDTYSRVLQRLRGIVGAWEARAEEGLQGQLKEAARARQRLPLLESDLDFLGVARNAGERPQLPMFADTVELLGAMYVMEGSRLGGQLISRHVSKTLRLDASKACSFFLGFGPLTGVRWIEFLDILRTQIKDSESERAVLGAKKMFHVFGEWMRSG